MNGAKHTTCRESHAKGLLTVTRDSVVSAAQKGLPATFPELYAIYSRRLYRIIVAITRNPADAEDALQDTFLRAYLGLDRFEGRSSVSSWLSQIAINSALMILRKRRARHEALFDPQPDAQVGNLCFQVKDSAPDPEEHFELQQRQLWVLRAIRRLSPELQGPLRMQMIHGWSMREISRALNISLAAVKARLHRARLRLSTVHVGASLSATRRSSCSLRDRGVTQ